MAPMISPALVPAIDIILKPWDSNSLITPKWAMPFTPPPPIAKVISFIFIPYTGKF